MCYAFIFHNSCFLCIVYISGIPFPPFLPKILEKEPFQKMQRYGVEETRNSVISIIMASLYVVLFQVPFCLPLFLLLFSFFSLFFFNQNSPLRPPEVKICPAIYYKPHELFFTAFSTLGRF